VQCNGAGPVDFKNDGQAPGMLECVEASSHTQDAEHPHSTLTLAADAYDGASPLRPWTTGGTWPPADRDCQ